MSIVGIAFSAGLMLAAVVVPVAVARTSKPGLAQRGRLAIGLHVAVPVIVIVSMFAVLVAMQVPAPVLAAIALLSAGAGALTAMLVQRRNRTHEGETFLEQIEADDRTDRLGGRESTRP